MMDAVEYIKNLDKMCATHVGCEDCPLDAASGKEDCQRWSVKNAEEAVRIVGEWIEAQRMTNLNKFVQVFRKYPDPIMELDPFYRGMPDEWWQAEYEEPPTD